MIAEFREFWAHRHDRPELIPQRVRWTTKSAGDPDWFVDRINETETHDGFSWSIDGVRPDPQGGSYYVRLLRTDGRYHWRDDGYRGL